MPEIHKYNGVIFCVKCDIPVNLNVCTCACDVFFNYICVLVYMQLAFNWKIKSARQRKLWWTNEEIWRPAS